MSSVSLAIRLMVLTPLFVLTPGCVDISQVMQKKTKKKQKKKNEITNSRKWKEETNRDLEQQTQESKVDTLEFYVCSWLSRDLSKNLTQQPKMLTHLIIDLTF